MEESLGSGRLRLQSTVIAPLYFILRDRVRPCPKKKKRSFTGGGPHAKVGEFLLPGVPQPTLLPYLDWPGVMPTMRLITLNCAL